MAARRNFYDQTITFECDECSKTFEADTSDFEDAVEDFKAHGDAWGVELCKLDSDGDGQSKIGRAHV